MNPNGQEGFPEQVTLNEKVLESAQHNPIADQHSNGANGEKSTGHKSQEGHPKIIEGNAMEEHFFPPTLVINPSLESKIMKEETFGPVMTIHSFNSDNEAINQKTVKDFHFLQKF